MKKSLIALAVLAAAGAASAQSSVTLYGRLDLGASSVKTTTVNNASASTSVKADNWTGDQSQRTTSRLGVKGVEDLGGGTKAFFNYEFKINPDVTDASGASQSSVATTRLANLGVQGGFGAVVIGTYLNSLDTVRSYSASTFDLPGGDFLAKSADGTFAKSVAAYAALPSVTSSQLATGVSGRSQDAIAYRAQFAGVKVGLGVTSNKTTTTSSTVSSTNKQQGYLLGLGYGAGPISVDLAYAGGKRSVQNAGGVTTIDGKVSDLALGLSYDLGFAKPYVVAEEAKSTNNLATSGSLMSLKSRAIELGSTFKFGAFNPYVLVSTGKLTEDYGVATATGKTSGWQVGSTYDLSKRTYVYAAFGQDKIKDDNAAQNTKNSGFGLGVVHQF